MSILRGLSHIDLRSQHAEIEHDQAGHHVHDRAADENRIDHQQRGIEGRSFTGITVGHEQIEYVSTK